MIPQHIIEIAREMNRQDNRGTSWPLFMVEVERERKVPRYGEDWDYKERVEDVDPDLLCAKCRSEAEKDGGELPDECADDECGDDTFIFIRVYRELNTECGIFLTEKACDEYIERRSYAHKNAKSYAISAHWSSEMRKVLAFLASLGSEDGKPADFYQ